MKMARPIKLFDFTQKCYQKIGIYPPQSNRNHNFNPKNLFFVCSMVHIVTLHAAFFLFEAKRLDEYDLSFYYVQLILSAIFYFISNIYQIDNIIKLIDKYEEFVGKSKSEFVILKDLSFEYFRKSKFIPLELHNPVSIGLHIALSEKIEKTSKLLYVIFMKSNAVVTLVPSLVGSIANFYIFDLGEESFSLPCPAWYVLLYP